MVRPATPSGAAGRTTLVNHSLERKRPALAQWAGRAFASLARTASPKAPVPEANSL
jgi:hypothetical protein